MIRHRARWLLVTAAVPAALTLTACTPGGFTTHDITHDVAHDLPARWHVTGSYGTDAGNCLVTCYATSTISISTPSGSAPEAPLRRWLEHGGWRRTPVTSTDPATRRVYPLGEDWTRDFDDRGGKSGSYDLAPQVVRPGLVRFTVSIDAHD